MASSDLIEIKKDERELYRIMKQLEKEGESIIDLDLFPEKSSITKKLGHKQELIEIWKTPRFHKKNLRLIRPTKNIDEIVELDSYGKNVFHFKRRKIA